VNAGKYRIYA